MWHYYDVLMIANNGTHFLGEIREAFDLLHITHEVNPGYGSLSNGNWHAYSGVILTGGEIHVYEPTQLAEVTVDEALLNRTPTPVLGICLGHQLIAHHYGAEVSPLGQDEAIRHNERPVYGLQFHPEASGHCGLTILSNFAEQCGETVSHDAKPIRRAREDGPK